MAPSVQVRPSMASCNSPSTMGLEEFEKQLAQEQAERLIHQSQKRKRSRSPDKRGEHRHRHHHSGHHHRTSRHTESSHDKGYRSRDRGDHEEDDRKARSHHRRRHLSRSRSTSNHRKNEDSVQDSLRDGSVLDTLRAQDQEQEEYGKPQRMSWMQGPVSGEVEHVRSKRPQTPPGYFRKATSNSLTRKGFEPEQDQASDPNAVIDSISSQHEVDYTFGDAGSDWRMKKLNGVYREAKETGRSAEDIALDRYGDLRAFDEAREEETEVDRRKMYGADYVGKEKPSGELFEERKLNAGMGGQRNQQDDQQSDDEFEAAQAEVMKEDPTPTETVPLDQSALNRLKADIMKARLQKAPNVAELEAKYEAALAGAAHTKQADVVVLNKMENRMLAGGRKGEVKEVTGKRGRERGLVEENEDMSIYDMVRQERRTRGQFGGDGRAFAERIAKDGKFNNDLDYMDDNAEKLAKSVQKSDINLRNTSINDYQKMKKILDTCPLCSREDTNTPPEAPVISLGTRTFLTLPTSPEITPYGFCASIVPTQHRLNLLECDDDEWEEIRNFMKSLTRFYYGLKPKRSVIFYENAAHQGRKRHASVEAVPLPMSVADNISQYFKEAILSADEEWTQHKKLIDTLKNSERPGFGKHAFRKSMVSELPYFHVWFRIDGGLGHVVEDPRRWPKGDLFAREIIGDILDVGPEIIKKQGRWRRGDPDMRTRVEDFKKLWEKWDWTKALLEAS